MLAPDLVRARNDHVAVIACHETRGQSVASAWEAQTTPLILERQSTSPCLRLHLHLPALARVTNREKRRCDVHAAPSFQGWTRFSFAEARAACTALMVSECEYAERGQASEVASRPRSFLSSQARPKPIALADRQLTLKLFPIDSALNLSPIDSTPNLSPVPRTFPQSVQPESFLSLIHISEPTRPRLI
eukprot:1803630-Rhodomonas_salina.2